MKINHENNIKFYSTNKESPSVDLREAVQNGLAPDGGLYMPERLPKLEDGFFEHLEGKPFTDVAFEVSKHLFSELDIPECTLHSMIRAACNFDVPLVEVDKDVYALELFHGPTLAFKDFGARFMAQLFGYYGKEANEKITILVATSGDTGSAVANGFFGIEGINVVILYPSGKVSPLQEKQLTSMGGNITALEVQGTFDDCHKMITKAFVDENLKQSMKLASANSINIARLLPQIFYYVYLCSQLRKAGKPIVVSVPSGNFGNLTAGIIAKQMGAPIDKLIASTNENDTVPQYLRSGVFNPKPSIDTLSNAMDVGNPSNFARMLELYGHDLEKMKQDISGVSFSDAKVKEVIAQVFKQHKYILDPHGAVAYLGLRNYLKDHHDSVGVFLETAHPAKFFEAVEQVIGASVPMPERLKKYTNQKKQATLLRNDFSELKNFLLTKN